MFKPIRRSSRSAHRVYEGRRRFEHWYVDNQIYFITARCFGGFPAFRGEDAKAVFWGRLTHYAEEAEFRLWIASVMPNHYHFMGYAKFGEPVGVMMQRLHGAVAKLVNDRLPDRRKPFWVDKLGRTYFDGCIRDETQCRRAYRYIQRQPVRHGICARREDYPHTRSWGGLDAGVRRALELGAFMEWMPYRRYDEH